MLLLLHVCMYVSVCPSVRDRFGVRQGRDLGHIKVVTQARPAGRGGKRGGKRLGKGPFVYVHMPIHMHRGRYTHVRCCRWVDGWIPCDTTGSAPTHGGHAARSEEKQIPSLGGCVTLPTMPPALPEQLSLVDAHIRTCMFSTGGNNGQACVRAPRLLCSALQKGTPQRAGDLGLARGGVSWSE